MGVTYKLKDEVIHFIISQRQSNPLASCRQLAESTSQKFGLNLSKSSVHDVLKESGIITPRGRKPKNKFEIPQEKKKQIQTSLSQVKLIPPLPEEGPKPILIADVTGPKEPVQEPPQNTADLPQQNDMQISSEYEGAGEIFLKAALWDLGIFSKENVKAGDWKYYLTYSKGIKVDLENDKSFFVDLPLPLERCIREIADGLVNNVKLFIVHKVSDEELFRACMDAQTGFRINKISIVDENAHVLSVFDNIMDLKRSFSINNRKFVESDENNVRERAKAIFFSQAYDNNGLIDNILNLKGFNSTNKLENVVTLLIDDGYENKTILQQAAENLNGMNIYDGQDRLVKVKVQ